MIQLSLGQEKYLKVFLDDGEVPMDNNAAEQSIRGFCIGKKKLDDTDRGFLDDLLPWSPNLSVNCRKPDKDETI